MRRGSMEKRNGTTVKYKAIAKDIEQQVTNGNLPKGSALSESQMQQKYNVSRVTIRKSFKVLQDKGVLRTLQGKGTYVNDLDTKDWTWMNSFSREVLESGHIPTSHFVNFSVVSANEFLAEHLQIAPRTKCFFMERLRCIDHQVAWLTKSYLPCKFAEGLNEAYFSTAGVAQSIFKILELNFHVICTSGQEVQEAISVTKQDAELLQIKESKPVISKSFIGYDKHAQPVIYEHTIMAQNITRTIPLK